MAWFGAQAYDRGKTLEAAAKARGRGQIKKAIGHYETVLRGEPDNYELQGKVAPLLVRAKRFDEAWQRFAAAGQGYIGAGHYDHAISIFAQASEAFPKRPEIWERLSSLYLERERRADAVRVLVRGSRHFRRKAEAATALRLLERGFAIAPWDFALCMTAARAFLRAGRAAKARELLEKLAPRVSGKERRRARFMLLWYWPSWGTLKGWALG